MKDLDLLFPPWLEPFFLKHDRGVLKNVDPVKFEKELEAFGVKILKVEANESFGAIYTIDRMGATERWFPGAMKCLTVFAAVFDFNVKNNEIPIEDLKQEIHGWGTRVFGTLQLKDKKGEFTGEYTTTQGEASDISEQQRYDSRRFM